MKPNEDMTFAVYTKGEIIECRSEKEAVKVAESVQGKVLGVFKEGAGESYTLFGKSRSHRPPTRQERDEFKNYFRR